MLTQFVQYSEVRAALGVSDEELEDETLALGTIEAHLVLDLAEVHAQVESTYLALAEPETLTADQLKFYRILRLFAAYSVAKHLLATLPLFSPRVIQDGRASAERVADPHASVKEGVAGMYSLLRLKLFDAFKVLVPSATAAASVVFTVLSSTGIAVDPVIGE